MVIRQVRKADWVYTEGLSCNELVAENEQLRAENAALKQRIAELEAALKEALAQLEAARRASKRQAAPFSRGERKANPQPPGRKKGHPPAHRPRPQRVDRVLPVLARGGQVEPHHLFGLRR